MATIKKTDAAMTKIKVTTLEPVGRNPYVMSFMEKKTLRGIIDNLLLNGILLNSYKKNQVIIECVSITGG